MIILRHMYLIYFQPKLIVNVLHIYILLHTGCKKVVLNEGMPMYRSPFEKGNLIINFDITFPSNKFAQEPELKVRQ